MVSTGAGIAAAISQCQHGVVTYRQLRRSCLSPAAIRHLVDSGEWRLAARGVLVRVGSPDSDLQRLLIAVLSVHHSAVASHLSAQWVWGVHPDTVRPHHVTVACRTTSKASGVRLHRVRDLPSRWLTRHQGIPVVRPELLAMQLFALNRSAANRQVDRLWSHGLISAPSIARFLEEVGERGRNGTAGLRDYLANRGDDYVAPASNLEARLNEILAEAGLTVRRQVDLGGQQWSGRVDFVCEGTRLVIEAQSERFHASLSDRQADAERRRRLERDGFAVVEVWDADVFYRPAEVVERVRRALRSLRT